MPMRRFSKMQDVFARGRPFLWFLEMLERVPMRRFSKMQDVFARGRPFLWFLEMLERVPMRRLTEGQANRRWPLFAEQFGANDSCGFDSRSFRCFLMSALMNERSLEPLVD